MPKWIKAKDIYGMARIGWIPPKDEKGIELYVHTDDSGEIPHFHVRKYGKHNKFVWETCIKYTASEYFLHGKHKDKLPSGIAKELDSMLRQPNPKRRGITYWQSAIDDWNSNNSKIQLDPDLIQPDYTKLA